MPEPLHLFDGKYTIQLKDNGSLEALRYGEPWRDLTGDNLIYALVCRVEDLTRERDGVRNALRLAESALASLTWTPLTERQPAEDDGNEVGDVEFSDGSDIWQAQFDDTEKATYWRRITLPAND